MIPDDKLLEEIELEILGFGFHSGLDYREAIGVETARRCAKKVLSKVQEHYVRLDDDQSLPHFRNAVNKSYNDYMLGQEDMIKAGFRKIEGGRE